VQLCFDLGSFAGEAVGALLALDLSKRRIGLATCDAGRVMASPLSTIKRKSLLSDAAQIAEIIKQRRIGGLVLGYPLNMDGSEGPACQAVRDTASDLLKDIDLPCLLQDERLTSEAVLDAIDEGRLRRPKKGEDLDHFAATVILQDAIAALGQIARHRD